MRRFPVPLIDWHWAYAELETLDTDHAKWPAKMPSPKWYFRRVFEFRANHSDIYSCSGLCMKPSIELNKTKSATEKSEIIQEETDAIVLNWNKGSVAVKKKLSCDFTRCPEDLWSDSIPWNLVLIFVATAWSKYYRILSSRRSCTIPTYFWNMQLCNIHTYISYESISATLQKMCWSFAQNVGIAMETLFVVKYERCPSNIEHYSIHRKVEFRLMGANKKSMKLIIP